MKYVVVRINSTSGAWIVEKKYVENSIADIAGEFATKKEAQKLATKLNKSQRALNAKEKYHEI